MVKIDNILFGLLLILFACNQYTSEDLIKARINKNPKPFIELEKDLYMLKDKKDYFFNLVSIQENSGLSFGYYDPNDITKDSMFLIYKDNIHFVYQTYFISLAFKAKDVKLNSEKFQDWCVFHQKLNEEQKDSIKKIFNLQIPIDSLKPRYYDKN